MDKKDVEVGDVVKFRIFNRDYMTHEMTVEALSEAYAQGRKAGGVQMYARYNEIFEVKKQPKKTIYTHTCGHYPLAQPTDERTRLDVGASICLPCQQLKERDDVMDEILTRLEELKKLWYDRR